MGATWANAKRRIPEWQDIDDPFDEGQPVRVNAHTPLWEFVKEDENGGMTDDRLRENFKVLFDRARENGVKTVITNGIRDVNRGNQEYNTRTDDNRVQLINEIITDYENNGFDVTLISSNDSYTRNFSQ